MILRVIAVPVPSQVRSLALQILIMRRRIDLVNGSTALFCRGIKSTYAGGLEG